MTEKSIRQVTAGRGCGPNSRFPSAGNSPCFLFGGPVRLAQGNLTELTVLLKRARKDTVLLQG